MIQQGSTDLVPIRYTGRVGVITDIAHLYMTIIDIVDLTMWAIASYPQQIGMYSNDTYCKD